MKFGLLSYDYTVNVGNEIQSIAARRFLPKVDYYIDHEKIESFDEDTDVKLIMNGWYLDCQKAWPPSENIDPLLVSMHFTNERDFKRAPLLTEESREFFSKNGPVGCRDFHTLNFLENYDIDAYYSGCLTLTLDSGSKKREKDEDYDYIVINAESHEKILSFLKDKTDKKIFVVSQIAPPSFEKAYPETMPMGINTVTSLYNHEEKFFMAESFLHLYENASCVITDRLHCALPCLALKTPVLEINNGLSHERFDGLKELMRETTLENYMNNYSMFDVDNPPENSKNYLKIRKNLIKTCEKFTGCINDSCYSDISYQKLMEGNLMMFSKNNIKTRKYISSIVRRYKNDMKKSKKQIKSQKNKINELNGIIKEQERIINEMKSSNSWKVTAPLRKIRNNK